MCERFYKHRKEIKMACTSANLEFSLSENELQKVNELCNALPPLKLAVENLSKQDATLLYADQMLQFVITKLSQQNSEIGQELKEAFEKRVLERRQTTLIHLLEYLDDPRFFELNYDAFRQGISLLVLNCRGVGRF